MMLTVVAAAVVAQRRRLLPVADNGRVVGSGADKRMDWLAPNAGNDAFAAALCSVVVNGCFGEHEKEILGC